MLNRRARQRGVSLVEMMIGLTVGLIVLSGILGLFSGHLRGNSDLIRTTRLNNELRGTMDMAVRDLRRATYWGASTTGVWYPTQPLVQANPFFNVDTGTAGQITYRYDVNSNGLIDANETFRLRRNAADGTVEWVQLDAGGAVVSTTPISDPDATNITGLTFAVVDRTATTTCLVAGPGPVGPTPPLLHVRQITVTLTGQLRADAATTRTLSESVRLRNDRVEGSCPS